MAIIKPNNNTISAITALPAAISTGKVLQVKQAVKTDTFSTNSTSFTDVTGLSVAITPSAISNKIFVMMDVKLGSSANVTGFLKIVRGSTDIYVGDAVSSRQRATYANPDDPSDQFVYQASGNFLDSPSTTSATTYKIQILSEPVENTGTVVVNTYGEGSNSAASATLASSITVMEIEG